MQTVKVVKEYNDLKLNRRVKAGETLEVADARATVLANAKVAEIVEKADIPAETKKTSKKPTKKKEA